MKAQVNWTVNTARLKAFASVVLKIEIPCLVFWSTIPCISWDPYSVRNVGNCSFKTSHSKYLFLKMIFLYRPSITFFYRVYTGCNRRNVRDFGRVFLMLNYTDITQNTYNRSWTVTEIMAIEMCGILGCLRTVRRPWRHTCPMRTPTRDMVMQLAHGSSDVTR